jgi:5-methyltetrahydropteroyltriglutamate--homocysteine methyltransferase
MTETIATTPGVFPLPDWAKTRLGRLKGHQKHDLIDGSEPPEVLETYEQARGEVIDDQRDAGMDRIVEGQLRWDDMLAHPLTINPAVETGGIVRYYDNNNFYRHPTVTEEPKPTGDIGADLDRAAQLAPSMPLQAVLPGPVTLADLSTDACVEDVVEFHHLLAGLLAGELERAPDVETLYLLEPSLVTAPPDEDLLAELAELYSTISAATDAETVVHTYFGALTEQTHVYVVDASVAGLGVDIVTEDRAQTVYNAGEYGLADVVALGVTDGQNTDVESATTVVERVGWFFEQLPTADPDRLYLSTNTEPFYLPVSKHQQKLAALAEAAARVPEEVV